MKLYKNVDICDLASILEKGILSLDESGNDNWENEKRAKNPTDRVYLFQPLEGKSNSYPKSYGVALLEVEVDDRDCQISEIRENDVHRNDYVEYTTSKVSTEQIMAIYIPELFKNRLQGINDFPEDLVNKYLPPCNIKLDESIMQRVTWCGMSADLYDREKEYIPADEKALDRFAKTAEIIGGEGVYNFFVGTAEKGECFWLYNVMYIF